MLGITNDALTSHPIQAGAGRNKPGQSKTQELVKRAGLLDHLPLTQTLQQITQKQRLQ